MSKAILCFLLLFSTSLFSQDTILNRIKNINPKDFTVYKRKKDIPLEYLKYLPIKDLRQIANPGKHFNTNYADTSQPQNGLNWVALDKNNRMVISISNGGYFIATYFYYICKLKDDIYTYNLEIPHKFEVIKGKYLALPPSTSFETIVNTIQSGRCQFRGGKYRPIEGIIGFPVGHIIDKNIYPSLYTPTIPEPKLNYSTLPK